MSFFAITAHAAEIELINKINSKIIEPILLLLMSLGFVVFLYGVYETIVAAESEDKRADGKRHMIWGVVGIAIMVSVFGILRVVCLTIGVDCH